MAYVRVNSFSLTRLPDDVIRVDVGYNVTLGSTESRLGIPSMVYVKLLERDGKRDETHLYAERWIYNSDIVEKHGNEDDRAFGWLFAGRYDSDATDQFSISLHKSAFPREYGREEWYCIVAAQPDIITHIAYSQEISANVG